ncbi:DUF805 domain-containing protein [Asticcacaulis sp.]|uniref:DUF805 domain-containing protein n=1 Tax=Asticcacaulis sp. TaxID=1872648 RepID=UPI003F7B5283
MGSFSLWHILILFAVLAFIPGIVLAVLLFLVRPSGPNRFGASAPARNFGDAITVCLSKFVDFNGRASRSEYWWFYLASFLCSLLVSTFARPIIGGFAQIVPLVLLLPGLAAGARRLHDTNRSALWLLLNLTGIGGLALLIVFALPPAGDDQARVFE